MADYIVEEIVNHNQNATHNDENIHENKVEIKQENVQQDDVKQEEIKQDEVKQEYVKQEEIKQDEVKQEYAKQEEIKQDEVKQEYVKQEEIQQEEIKQDEEVKPTKPKAKPKAKSKPKLQEDTGTKLTKAEMKEMADINNQFYALLNRIQKIPNLNDKLTKELLKDKKTQIKVNDEIINLKDSNYIIIEVV